MSTMKFCRKCNNVLYPKEDKELSVLLYACRYCDHKELATSNVVYRNKIHHSVQRHTPKLGNVAADSTLPLQNVAADPTLPRTKSVRCSQCNHAEAVFFQAPVKGEEGMALMFVCCNPTCGSCWRD